MTARRLETVPPTALVLAAVASVQIGGALAKTLFGEVGPGGAVMLRMSIAAVVLWLLWRPDVRRCTREDWMLTGAFALALGGMNLSFYAALDRVPLGVAVTLEFVGPLAVAVAGSRRALDLLWVLLAAAGILLLSDPGGATDSAGIALALLAGAFWGAYILLSARVARRSSGGTGLALAIAIAAVALLPVGIADGGAELIDPAILGVGAAVALLSSAIPYSLELEALRRIPAHVFGVLMSLEPAMAAAAGLVVLGEVLGARELVAIALVVAASVGATRSARATTPPPHD